MILRVMERGLTSNKMEDAESSAEDGGAELITSPHQKGIYLLPNLLTTGTLFGGFYAILASLDGRFEAAAIAVFVAMFFDGLDGRVARMTNTQSQFGVQYDSLSDMVAFGVAPAVMMYTWMLQPVGTLGWAAAFIFVSCAALRLARFNVQSETADRKYFTGLASPPAAALLAGMVWSGAALEPFTLLSVLLVIITAISGLLMVSNFRYYSFKEIDLRGRGPFILAVGVMVAITIVIIDPPRVLMLMALTYVFSGPIAKLSSYLKTRVVSSS